MKTALSRREFLGAAPTVCTAAALLGVGQVMAGASDATTGSQSGDPSSSDIPVNFPGQHPDAVQEVVKFAHFDLDRVQKIVTARPALAKASWDWGYGDWESAIGAASHVGRPDIVDVLMKYGGRPTIFTFTMMGNIKAVRAIVEASPGIQRMAGPHGITLLAHARFGGSAAQQVADYLESLGDADIGPTSLPIPDDERAAIQGVYAFGKGSDERLKIFDKKGKLAIERPGKTLRYLFRVGPREYYPTGAPAVRLRFDTTEPRPAALTVVDAMLTVRARRVDM